MKKEILNIMHEMLEIQGSDGNWNYDSYMHGLYNGMEFMLSIAEEREPKFKKSPKEWLKDKKDNSKPISEVNKNDPRVEIELE